MDGHLIVVGSHDLWVTPDISSIVLGRIVSTDVDRVIGVRVPRGSDEPTTPLERFVNELGPRLGRTVFGHRALTNTKGDVWRRDYEMVEHAVAVLAFFAPDREMDGGTGHVVQAALTRNIPVEAYRLRDDGSPELLGSDEGTQGEWKHDQWDPNPGGFTLYPPQGTPLIWTSSGTNATISGAWNANGTTTAFTNSTGGFIIPNSLIPSFNKP